MTAVLLTELGGPEVLQVRHDVPVPSVGPRQVLVQVGAAAVNNTDINTRIGWYSPSSAVSTAEASSAATAISTTTSEGTWRGEHLPFPRIQGADVSGTIVAVGDGVDKKRIGERVLINPCPSTGNEEEEEEEVAYLGSESDGGFAQFCCVPSRSAHVITNDRLTMEQLASFPCSYSTAENALARAQCTADDTVLITGASGGVGSAAVQLAKRRGATVIAVCRISNKGAALRAMGADRIIDRDDDLVEALGRDSVSLVYDVVGGPKWPRLLDVLQRRGRLCTSGAIAGPVVSLDLRKLYLKDLTLMGTTALDHGSFAHLVQYINNGELQPLVAATYPLADIHRAQQDFLAKKHVGKLVLVPPPLSDKQLTANA